MGGKPLNKDKPLTEAQGAAHRVTRLRKSRAQRKYVTGFKNLNSELIYSTQLDGEVTGSRPFTYQEALDDIKYTELHKQGESMVVYKLVPIIVKHSETAKRRAQMVLMAQQEDKKSKGAIINYGGRLYNKTGEMVQERIYKVTGDYRKVAQKLGKRYQKIAKNILKGRAIKNGLIGKFSGYYVPASKTRKRRLK